MKTLKIECTLNEQELDDIARGLGWTEISSSIDADGRWVSAPNTQSFDDYIVQYFTNYIAGRVKDIFVQSHKQALLETVNVEVEQFSTVVESNISSKLTSSIEDATE